MQFSGSLSFCGKKLLLLAAGAFSFALLKSQSTERWLQLWQSPNANFYEVKNAFDSAWTGREAEMQQQRHQKHVTERSRERQERANEKLDGTYFQFKRWEWYMEPRIGPSGELTLPGTTFQRFNEYLNSNPAAMAQHNASVARMATAGTWSFMGPTGAPSGSGAGRLCCIRFEPGNSNTIYVGAPCGGLWKSTDAGTTWNCLTDFLPVIGCSDVAIDPTNTNVLYLATGDNDAGDSPSIGVLKSTDGGITWNTTGLIFPNTAYRRIGKLLIDPTNSNVIYAATSAGIYKTYDAGVNWYQVSAVNTMDMEFKPGDHNTIYAGRINLFRTTNAGASWTLMGSGLPQTNTISRIAIAVTPAAPDNVYVLVAKASTQGFNGFFLSTNDGTNFTSQATSPNILGWDENGGDTDGQGWYDLSIAVAPYDANTVITGGVNVWRSDDMGLDWSLNAHWYGGGGAPYVHADVHDIVFDPQTQGSYYVGCDGGIFHTGDDGATFQDISHNLCIAQIYRAGVSGSVAGTLISGHQDNGTNVKVGTNYFSGLGGDGMDCFIDRTNSNIMFGELYYGDFYRSNNGGNNWNGVTSGTPGNGDWVTPWEQDPVQANVIYSGFDQLYKSVDQGDNWSPVGTTTFGTIKDFEVAASDRNYIYLSTGTSIWRSEDAGASWTNIGGNLNFSVANITRIAVSSYDANKIWISLSGYTANTKVYYSSDAGSNWTNLSYGLPNIPANCIVAVPGTSSDAIYVGMDVGVYYHDNSSAGWQPFFTALPNTPVFDLDIFLPTMKLTAATYGRGMWEADIDPATLTPLADFSATPRSVCPGQSVQFTDLSTYSPTSWSWTFPGGTPSTSTQQNPVVTYNTPGTYATTLLVHNGAGSATVTHTSYITVSGAQQPPYVEGFVPPVFLPAGWTDLNAGNQNFFWERSATVGHNSSESAYFDNFNYNVSGDRDEMRSMGLNFSGYTSLSLTFDVAYARFNNLRSDTLEVLVSDDCGATWNSVYIKGGNTLATSAVNMTTAFVPGNNQWRNESISINTYAGQDNVLVAFRNRGHHGNLLYVDNINITGVAATAPVAAFNASMNVCQNNSITFNDLSAPAPTSWSWTFPGGNPSSSSQQNPSVTWSTPGTYTVSLVASNGIGSDSVAQVITVYPAPLADAGVDTNYCSTTYVQLNASGGVSYSWTPSSGLSNPLIAAPGVYMTNTSTFFVNVTDTNGCVSRDSVHIIIHPLPNFSVSVAPANICPGDTSDLTSNNASWTYVWSPSSSLNVASGDTVIATPLSTTTYTITATDAIGCVSTTTKTVTVYPPLAVPTVLVNGWQLTCSTPGYTYQWYLNGNPIAGATSQTYLAIQVGNYSVEAHSYQGCDSGISPAVLVDGIKEENGLSFSIAPNPSNGAFDLSFVSAAASDFSVNIFSIDGKLVYLEELPRFSGTYRKQIDLSGFGAGSYIIRLSDGKKQTVQHLIIF